MRPALACAAAPPTRLRPSQLKGPADSWPQVARLLSALWKRQRPMSGAVAQRPMVLAWRLRSIQKNPHKTPRSEGSPMRDALLQARITRRSALQMAGAAVLPALIKPARAAEPSTMRVAFAIQPATLDPQKMRVGGVDYNYVYNCFSRLTAQDPQLQVQPDLATSWDATEDLKTWTFHLRPGVKFHNGKPFDASDVIFTFKRILDKDVGCVLRVNFSMVDSIGAVDPLTVRFNLSIPYADLPAAAAAYQAAIVTESPVDTLTTNPIGTRPFC